MEKNKRLFVVAILGALGVALGALGAHFLKAKVATGILSPDQLNGFETGVKYQMYHVIAMLILILLNAQNQSKYFNWAYYLFFVGIILFSGSLYFLCTRNLFGAEWLKVLGPVTPLGGICFILGWLCLGLTAIPVKKG